VFFLPHSSSYFDVDAELLFILPHRSRHKPTCIRDLIESVLHDILMIGNIAKNLCAADTSFSSCSKSFRVVLVSKDGKSSGTIEAGRYLDT